MIYIKTSQFNSTSQCIFNDTSLTSNSVVYMVTFPQTFCSFFFSFFKLSPMFTRLLYEVVPANHTPLVIHQSAAIIRDSLSPSSIFLSLNYQSLSFGPNHPSFSFRPVELIRFTTLPREEVKYFLSLQVQKARLLNRLAEPRNPSTDDTRLTKIII